MLRNKRRSWRAATRTLYRPTASLDPTPSQLRGEFAAVFAAISPRTMEIRHTISFRCFFNLFKFVFQKICQTFIYFYKTCSSKHVNEILSQLEHLFIKKIHYSKIGISLIFCPLPHYLYILIELLLLLFELNNITFLF